WNDVRMRQPRGDLRLAQELLATFGGTRQVGRQHLDRDFARQTNLAREVNDAHSPAPELAVDRVLAGERRLKTKEQLIASERLVGGCRPGARRRRKEGRRH